MMETTLFSAADLGVRRGCRARAANRKKFLIVKFPVSSDGEGGGAEVISIVLFVVRRGHRPTT